MRINDLSEQTMILLSCPSSDTIWAKRNYYSALRYILFSLFQLFTFLIAVGQGSGRIIEYNTRISVQGNTLVEEKSFVIQVDDKKSDWLSDISIGYNKSEKLEVTEAVVSSTSGSILRKLGKKEIVTRSDISDGSLYEDDYVMEFSLRHGEYPYRIKYSYRRTTDRFIYLAAWSPQLHPVVPSLSSSLSIELPYNYAYRLYSSGDLSFSKDSLEKGIRLSWKAAVSSPLISEYFAPAWQEIMPSVFAVPLNFSYGIPGSLESWAKFGLWHSEINKDLLTLPEEEKHKVNQIIKDAKDKHEIAKRLYHYMQDNTRYINVSIDVGGLKPYPASYVCHNRYGDCKALTIYMMALLRYAGIESHYSLVWAGEKPVAARRDFPSPQFNHVILCVPLEKDTIWLENTSSLLPFGYLGTFTQNRQCFVVNGDESRLVRIPALKPGEVLVRSDYVIEPDLSGSGIINMRREQRGNEFEKYLPVIAELNSEQQRSVISDMISLKNEVITCRIYREERDSRSVYIDAKLKAESVFRKIGSSLVYNFTTGILPALEKPGERMLPVKINYPLNFIDSVAIRFPAGTHPEVLFPDNTSIGSKYGSYSTKYSIREDNILIYRHFILNSGAYPLDEYKGLYDFIEEVRLTMKKSGIILNGII